MPVIAIALCHHIMLFCYLVGGFCLWSEFSVGYSVQLSLVSDMCVLHMVVDGYAARWSFRESAALECIR